MRTKQKIVHRRGPSNLNLGIFVYSFDVCRASQRFPSINYGMCWKLFLSHLNLDLKSVSEDACLRFIARKVVLQLSCTKNFS